MDKTMDVNFVLMIYKIYPSVDLNFFIGKFKPINQVFMLSLMREHVYKTLGTSIIYSLVSFLQILIIFSWDTWYLP